jgi:hypothetical protein
MRNRIHPARPKAERRATQINRPLRDLARHLKDRLAREYCGDLPEKLVHRAVGEAEALAALDPFPHLILTVLAEEKVLAMRTWFQRQQDIFERSACSFAE